MIRHAREGDFSFLRGVSTEPSNEALRAQIGDGRVRIIEHDGRPVGFLKFVVLWENLPFVEVLFLAEPQRGHGFGRQAMRDWEREMAQAGHSRALTSTQADETAQVFWRKIGYEDCGSFHLPDRQNELMLQRDISLVSAA